MGKLLFLTLVVTTIGAVPSESQSHAAEEQPDVPLTVEEQKSELAKLYEVFAAVDKLPAKAARWVEIQAGSVEQKTWHKGWLLRESNDEIQLLTENGWKETFDKKKLAAKKPAVDFQWSDVWAVRDGDFAKFCRDLMADKKKETKDDPDEIGAYRFQRERAEADAAVVDSARIACWASAMGHEELASQLIQRAMNKLQERRATYASPAEAELHAYVAGKTSPHSDETAGDPLSERDPRESRLLALELNRALARIPYRADHGAILSRIKQLESLIAEDRAWKEPTKQEFAAMDVKQKAAYWLHHLRDLNVTQSSSPGMCMVLTDSRWSFMQSQDLAKAGTPNPAVELNYYRLKPVGWRKS